jgi:hypothetical protein
MATRAREALAPELPKATAVVVEDRAVMPTALHPEYRVREAIT